MKYKGAVSALLTLVILIFSEILPKTLGARYAPQIAPIGAYIILFLSWISYPILILSEKISKLFPEEKKERDDVKEEMIVTAEMNEAEGSLEKKEGSILKNLLNLDKLAVAEIMTPRKYIQGYQKDMSVRQILEMEKNIRYSRFPVYGEDFDDIVGVVHRYKLFESQRMGEEEKKISDLCSPVYYISQSQSVANALTQFIKTKQHIFIVLDPYGATCGILSLEDSIESLLGEEIIDEYDVVDEDHRIQYLDKEYKSFLIKKKT